MFWLRRESRGLGHPVGTWRFLHRRGKRSSDEQLTVRRKALTTIETVLAFRGGPISTTKGLRSMNIPMILTVAVATFVAGCASDAGHSPAPPGATSLTGSQIPEALNGKTLKGTTWQKKPFTMKFHPDGTEIFQESGETAKSERWVVKGNQVCVSSPTYPEECSEVKVSGQELWFIIPGTQKTRNRMILE